MAVTIDEIFKTIGEFRQYQWYLLSLMGYCLLTAGAFNGAIVAFITAEPDWKCVDGYMNNTVCRFNQSITLTSDDYKARCKMPREAWTFVDDFTSIVTEYDLVCDDSIFLSLAQSATWITMLVCLPIAGYLSDKYGRRIIVGVGFVLNAAAAMIPVFPISFMVFIASRLIYGCGSGFENSSSFTLLTEFTTEKFHSWLGIGYYIFWAIGLIVLPLIAFFAREWRIFTLITFVCASPIVLLVWLIPESPRWLLLHNKENEARNQLLKIAKMNKKTLPDDDIQKPVISEHRASLRQLFLSWKVTKITLISWNLWLFFQQNFVIALKQPDYQRHMTSNLQSMVNMIVFTHALVYYGVSVGSIDLGGNKYLNFFLVNLMELPANFAISWAVNRFGRKIPIISGLISTIVASAISASIPADRNPANVGGRVTAAILARLFITFSFNGCYIWTSELYPTVIRATGMSTSSSAARIGSFAASYIIWLIRIHIALPYSIFGVICIQAAILGLFLPETKGVPTLETIDDMKKESNIAMYEICSDKTNKSI